MTTTAKSMCNWTQLCSLALGQLISLLITSTGICSQMLAQFYGVNIPTSQSFLNYVLLGAVYGLFTFAYKRQSIITTFRQRAYIYLPLAIVDVEANFLVVKAYQYTSITSVMLLDCFTIPCSLVLTYIFLKTRYNWRHYVGVFACLAGLGVLVYDDAVKNNSAADGSSPLLGDLLCLGGATLYAISNVGQEKSVKTYEHTEYLAMIGIFGSVVAGIQLAITERNQLASVAWSASVVLYILGFVLTMFALYSLAPFMLKMSGSTLYNLSLLTSDAYSIIAGIFLFDKTPSVFYFVALAIIVCGLLLYNINDPPHTAEDRAYQSVNSETTPPTPINEQTVALEDSTTP